ncbi:MAG TPA: hypothetical protein VEI02_06000 [Planctomycetota bacterium]|nr:hypothetical protein [Planctomycetota bacterium]
MSPSLIRAFLAVGALLSCGVAASAQESRPAPASRPAPESFQPPGRTYRMPGAGMPETPRDAWASRGALLDFAKDVVKRSLPDDGGALWIGAVVLLVVAGRFAPFRPLRNVDLLMLLGAAAFMTDLQIRHQALDDPAARPAFVAAYTGLYAVTAWWWVRGLIGALAARGEDRRPNVRPRALAALALFLFVFDVGLAAVRTPDDCGHYTNLGAQRMLETGGWPYGDKGLVGGAGATYGPVLYLAHAGFLALQHDPTPNPPDALPDPNFGYHLPPRWATRASAVLFHALTLLALFLVGRRARDAATGWALVALYAGSPYVIGLGGEGLWLSGMTYVSHLAPAAMVALAFAALPRPFLCGALLNLAVGTGYFPAFFFPAWTAYFATRARPAWKPFLAGFFLVGLVTIAAVWFGTRADPEKNPAQLFLEGTIAHQEAPDQYGSSTLSFWHAQPSLRALLRRPLFGGEGAMWTPMFFVVAGYSLLGFLLGRRRTPAQLAWLTASTIACVQLWKHHASGTYVEWYYPLLLIALHADAPEARDDAADAAPGPSPPSSTDAAHARPIPLAEPSAP